jgi:hypothetical protein
VLLVFSHSIFFCLVAKTHNVAIIVARFGKIVRFALTQHHCGIVPLDSFSFFFNILCIKCTVIYSVLKLSTLSPKTMIKYSYEMQALEQSHDNIFVCHEYLQANELICECLYFVDAVQQIIAVTHLAREELAANKNNV